MAAGAGRSRIVRMLLTESLLLATAGGIAGVLLAGWTVDLVWSLVPDLAKLAVEIDGRVWLYTAAVSVVATILFGLVPALHATRVDVAPLLKGDDPAADRRRGVRTRTFFLVTQFASSMVLLVIA